MTTPSWRVSSDCLEERGESASNTTWSGRGEWEWEDVSLISWYSSGSSDTIPVYSVDVG